MNNRILIIFQTPENSFPLSILNCEKWSEESNKDTTAKIDAELDASSTGTEHPSPSEAASSLEHSLDTLVLLCCENSLRLYSMKSVIQVPLLPLLCFSSEHCCASICTLKRFTLYRARTKQFIK